MSRLFVKNLPKQTTDKSLRTLFGQKGTVTDCSLKFVNGEFRRFAFIGFSSAEEAQEAQKFFDKTYINSSKISVEMAADLGSVKPRPWSKYSKTKASEKTEKEKQIEAKKKKKVEKDTALLGELQKDQEFKDYLAVHTRKGQIWDNDAGDDDFSKVTEGDTDEKQKDDEDEERSDNGSDNEVAKEDSKGKAKKMSDLDFLKSKMTDTALLSSDDDDDDDDDDGGGDDVKEKKGIPKKKRSEMKLEDGEKGKTSHSKQREKNKTQEMPMKKFYIKMKGLPTTIKESAVREFFRPLTVKINIPRGKNKLAFGFAYIECRSEKDLEAALAKNKNFIGKKKVFLKRIFEEEPVAKAEQEKPRPWEQKVEMNAEEEESIAESGRLFVRNLYYQCSEEELQALFAKFGPLADFDLPVDSFTKQCKGFAHVVYMMPEHAVQALAELDGKTFMGRILHILPGKDRETKYTSSEKSSYKKQKDEKTKALAKSSHNWNTLFVNADAVATWMAAKYQTDKSHVLDDSGKGSVGVRQALGETQLIQETKQFLTENGIALDSFGQADAERSKTVIIAKDLPVPTQEEELHEVFSKYGTVMRVLMPPYGSTAIIEFQEPSEAKRAFTKLAYRRFKYLPLYLEWAPMAVFNKDKEQEELAEDPRTEEAADGAEAQESSTRTDQGTATPVKGKTAKEDSGVESGSEGEMEPGSTVFVKNLNFLTQEADLKELFGRAGSVRRVTIAKKKDMKNPGKFLSMGYGFVEFKTAAAAKEALKILQKHELDDHKLELKISHRETLQPKSSRKRQGSSSQKGSTKILVRNIPFQCNRKEIEELFKVFGELKYVRVPKKVSGPGIQGFAFVDFLTKQDAKRAFDALCQSTHLFGRRLVLEWANTVETVEDLQRKTAQKFHDGGPSRKFRKKAIMEALE